MQQATEQNIYFGFYDVNDAVTSDSDWQTLIC